MMLRAQLSWAKGCAENTEHRSSSSDQLTERSIPHQKVMDKKVVMAEAVTKPTTAHNVLRILGDVGGMTRM